MKILLRTRLLLAGGSPLDVFNTLNPIPMTPLHINKEEMEALETQERSNEVRSKLLITGM